MKYQIMKNFKFLKSPYGRSICPYWVFEELMVSTYRELVCIREKVIMKKNFFSNLDFFIKIIIYYGFF